jgi:hypothetical protein
MPNRAALHEDDRVVAVFPRNCRRQSKNKLRFRTPNDLFKAVRRKMMALVDNQMPVLRDAIIDNSLAYETLNHGDVEIPGRLPAATSNLADVSTVDVKKRAQTLDPLIEQLPAVYQHKRVHAALSDQPGCDNGFPERRRCRQHPDIVSNHGSCRRLLLRAERSLKGEVQRFAVIALVFDNGLYIQVREKLMDLFHAATGQSNVVGMLLRTGDDARLIVGGQTHDLSFVEFGILESCEAKQPIAERRGKLPLTKINLVSEYKLQRRRNITRDRRLLPTA